MRDFQVQLEISKGQVPVSIAVHGVQVQVYSQKKLQCVSEFQCFASAVFSVPMFVLYWLAVSSEAAMLLLTRKL